MLRRFAWATLLLNIGVILWGAVVRATGSGAGCGSHWPDCNGVVVPHSPSVETAIEFSHRLTSGLALVCVVVLTVWVFRSFAARHPARRAAVTSLVVILIEALIGALLVKFELTADSRSLMRAPVVAIHLANTFLLLGALTWCALACQRPVALRFPSILLSIALIAILLVSMAGAVTALGDTLFPSESVAEGVRRDFSPGVHWLIRLRILHPLGALFTAMVVIAAAVHAARGSDDATVKRLANIVLVVVFAQMLGGVLNILLLAPVWMQIAHLALADLLWITLVSLGLTAARLTQKSPTETMPAQLVPSG